MTERKPDADVYLGDSVYAKFDGFGVWLMTWNGHEDDPRNLIYLEPYVFQALLNFVNCVPGEPMPHLEKQDE